MKPYQTVADGLLVRLGTLLSATFLGWGLHADNVNLIVPAVLVIAGVGVDLAVGAVVKRWAR